MGILRGTQITVKHADSFLVEDTRLLVEVEKALLGSLGRVPRIRPACVCHIKWIRTKVQPVARN